MKVLFVLLLVYSAVYSEDLDALMERYTHNNDLSEKTKLQSGGSSTIYTRIDLDTMQAHTLKDLLKSHPIARYKESRSGIADLNYHGDIALFSSSDVRIYIDNQELTSATFGSGLGVANTIDLDTINHVEIYTNSPSYEYSTEPTYILIKLYTKTANRDRGGKVALSYGSKGFNKEFAYYADELKDFSYVFSASRTDDKKQTYYSHNIPLDRDSQNYSALATIYDDNHKLQVLFGKSDMGTSIASSTDATFEKSTGYYTYVHIGYETTIVKNLLATVTYMYANIGGENKPTILSAYNYPALYDRDENSINAELKYKQESQNNRLIVGGKFRGKIFKLSTLKIAGVDLPIPSYNEQDIYTLYLEERYNISEHNIISIGGQFAIVENNGDIDNADLIQYRIHHTYLFDAFAFKSSIYHTESVIEPYLYVDFPTQGSLEVKKLDAISMEVGYAKYKNEIKLVATYGVTKDAFFQPYYGGGYQTYDEKIKEKSAYIEYSYMFDIENKLITNISYYNAHGYDDIAGYIRLLNNIGKLSIFNEVIYNRSDVNKHNYFDYSAGIKYHYSEALNLAFKGENIFDSGYENSYKRFSYDSLGNVIDETPLMISPIEQRFFVSMEYLF